MREKKIDLSDVEVGDKLWTIQEGETTCVKNRYNMPLYKIVTGKITYTLDGKVYYDDKYPSCFHNYQEFLDFHGVAPVRMTEKELVENFNLCKEAEIEGISLLREGFLLGGGQIIEEPANLPCPLCGNEMVDHEGHHVRHPNGDCVMAQYCFDKKQWNDPSKRGNSNV
jgi:hypothetical protein